MTKQKEQALRNELKLRNRIGALLMVGIVLCLTILTGIGLYLKYELNSTQSFSVTHYSTTTQSVD